MRLEILNQVWRQKGFHVFLERFSWPSMNYCYFKNEIVCVIYSLTEMPGWRVLKGIFGGKVGGGSYNRRSQAWEGFGLNMNWSITAEFTYMGSQTRSLWWWLMMARARARNKTFYARLEVSQKSLHPSQPIEVVRISSFDICISCTVAEQVGYEVPPVHLLCEEPKIIGTPFYVMSFVEAGFWSIKIDRGW